MTALVKYDAAKKALATARRVDEVKKVRDLGMAQKLYARQAKDRQMCEDAAEIIKRAEFKLAELIDAQRQMVGLNRGAKAGKTGVKGTPVLDDRPTLADTGIDKNLAKRIRRAGNIAAKGEAAVEAEIERVRAVASSSIDKPSQQEKADRREQREQELATKIAALPDKRYGVIYSDPPWRFEPYSRDTGMDRAADNHYPTLGLEEIKAMKIPTAVDAVLFLWATVPMLPEALEIMQAWGFHYRSQFVWVKDKIGTGYWTRNQHELLLIGARGAIPAPTPGQQYPSVCSAPIEAHSRKPHAFRDAIEKMFPTLPRIELFARDKLPGWDVWGYEAPQQAAE